jgi:hypothetical protein
MLLFEARTTFILLSCSHCRLGLIFYLYSNKIFSSPCLVIGMCHSTPHSLSVPNMFPVVVPGQTSCCSLDVQSVSLAQQIYIYTHWYIYIIIYIYTYKYIYIRIFILYIHISWFKCSYLINSYHINPNESEKLLLLSAFGARISSPWMEVSSWDDPAIGCQKKFSWWWKCY